MERSDMVNINETLKRLKVVQSKMANLRKQFQTAPSGEKWKLTLKIQECLEEFRELDNELDFYGVYR